MIQVFNSVMILLLLLLPGQDEDEKLNIGEPVPTFFARTLDGNDFFLSRKVGPRAKNNKGPVAISFFTTSCIPCRKEIPFLEKLSAEYPEVDFYLFNVGEEPSLVQRYVDKMSYKLPVLLDRYGSVAKKMCALKTPTFILISEDGNVEIFKQGFGDGDEEILNTRFAEYFRGGADPDSATIEPESGTETEK